MERLVMACVGIVIMVFIVVFAVCLVKGASRLEREIEAEGRKGRDRHEV